MGTRLDGKWFLDALLGYGGSAAVYGATHRNGKRAAIKVLHPHCVADESLRSRFVREGYVANKIGHPGAVSVLDDDVSEDGVVYLVMELLEGASLERIGRGEAPPLAVHEVVRIADDLLDVLAQAHRIGIVHRDVKPANIFVTKSGELKVLDFGIARLAESTLDGSSSTQTGFMMGTPAFMPPEQARARWAEVDARSDIWAVGATMIALLIARRPRLAETPNEELLLAMTAPLAPVSTLAPNIPPELAAVIDRAAAFDREQRWPSAEAMQEALRLAVKRSEPRLVVPPTLQASAVLNTPTTPIYTPSAPLTGPQLPGVPLSRPSPDLETSHHGLTTGRAVLQSARPNTTLRSSSGAISILLGVAIAVAIASVILYARSRGGSTDTKTASASSNAPTTTSTASTTTALATTTVTPTAMTATDVPPTGTAPPAGTTDDGAGAGTTRTTASLVNTAQQPQPPRAPIAHPDVKPPIKPVAPARASTSSSANPSKYFDSRY